MFKLITSNSIKSLKSTSKHILILSCALLTLTVQADPSAHILLIDPTIPFGINQESTQESNTPISAPAQRYKLSSILVREDRKIAVLNSQRVSVGDNVGEALVLSIEKSWVNLSIAGENKVLTVHQDSLNTLSVKKNQSLVVINP